MVSYALIPDPAAALAAIRFNADGLVAAVAQQHDSGEVLMLAWMNAAAVRETLQSGEVCYFSRSRQALWRKGERSGQRQRLVQLLIDCDGDSLLLRVDQQGVACHTGHRSCFYSAATADGVAEIAPVLVAPEILYPP
jgi:phosphoribosyl-AMP cyclohydrolase